MQEQKIPQGYKKTDIGIIPEDWEVKKLGDIFDIVAGGDLDKTKFSKIKTSKHKYPIYSNSLENNGLYGYSIDYKYPENSITVTARGTLGYATPRYKKFNAIIRLLVLLPKNELDIKFIAEYINNRVNFSIESTGVPQLTAPQISIYEIPLPPLSEQRAIARVLSDVDGLIESLDRLINKKKMIKKGAMQQLLTGRQRLPGFTGKWVRKKLGEIADFKNGKTLEKYITKNGKYYLITLDSLDIEGKLKKEHLRTNFNGNFLSRGDLVMILSDVAHGNFLGLTDVIPEDNKYLINQRVAALKNVKDVLPFYLSKYINIKQNYFKTMGQGSSQQNLNKKDVLNFEVFYPPTLEEQQAIAQILSDMDAEIEALEKKKAKYEMLKKGLMEQLLTGKIRLKNKIKS
jgi:type I restriction enzyme S subunit